MKLMCNIIFMSARMCITKITRVFNQVGNLQLKFEKDEKKFVYNTIILHG